MPAKGLDRFCAAASVDGKENVMTRSRSTASQAEAAPRFPTIVAAGVGVVLVLTGLWGFFDPRSFFDSVAVFEPFNRHFIRDIGAFQVGLGAVLLLAVFLRDALLVALSGVGVGAAFHAVSHLVDRGEGGDPARDIATFVTIAALLIVAAAVRRNGIR